MIRNISGVILAGGACKRFNGLIKPLIAIDGKTIISRMIDAISDILNEIIIVTNTPALFKEYKYCRIVNDQFLKKAEVQYMQMDKSEKTKIAFTNINSPGDLPPLKTARAGMNSLFFRYCNVQQFEYCTNTIFINFISIKNLMP